VLNIIKDHGVPDESVMPYQSQVCAHNDGTGHLACNAGIGAHCSIPNSCNMGALAPDHVWKVTSFGSSSGTVSHVKQQLLCKGPLSVCSGSWWHCVVLVGWDNNVNGGSWLIKNSWGTGWGTNGYGWIKFDGEAKSEIRNEAQFMSGVFKVGGA
jgi:C1A family cysteine protease